jgi:hypothetical protein
VDEHSVQAADHALDAASTETYLADLHRFAALRTEAHLPR